MARGSVELEFDVVVVGGGPSGLAAASALAGERQTLVLEKRQVPRRKSCGGLLGPLSLRLLEGMGLQVPSWVRAVPYRPWSIRFVNLDSGSDRVVPNTELANVHRESFDNWLWQEASKVAMCMAGTECVSVKNDDHPEGPLVDARSTLTFQRYSIRASDVVVADGARSPIRHSLTGERPESAVTVQEAIGPTHKMLDDVVFIVSADITPLYSWVVPKGDYWLLGSAFFGVRGIAQRFAELKRRVSELMGLTGEVLWRDVAHGSVLRHMEQVDLGHGRVHFVGEAAGLLNQATGEGLSFALESGILCAAKLLGRTQATPEGGELLMRRLQDSLKYSLFLSGDPLLLREYMVRNQGF